MTQSWTLGYCTNIHAAINLDAIKSALDQYAVTTRSSVFGAEPMGVGLWLAADAMKPMLEADTVDRFSEWLQSRSLLPYTINGFPYHDFHQSVVKGRVYHPAWWKCERRDYTVQLATLLARLLPNGENGSISTLPIGWPDDHVTPESIALAVQNLRTVITHLEQIEQTTGSQIVLALEPEPGCILSRCEDVIQFFDQHFPSETDRRYLTVCHDVCHSAVMFEDQADVLARYARAGISIGKVQVSNAIEARWSYMSTSRREEASKQLREFVEDRYLHQTGRKGRHDGFELCDDLVDIIHEDATKLEDEAWRVHFHIPIFLEKYGHLNTTQDEIFKCVAALNGPQSPHFNGHIEVETYAWSVLPDALQRQTLVDDLTREMRWIRLLVAEQKIPETGDFLS